MTVNGDKVNESPHQEFEIPRNLRDPPEQFCVERLEVEVSKTNSSRPRRGF